MYIFFLFSGKEGIYLEDHVADNVVDDRFSFRSNDPNNYSPSFYHFRPSKTSVSRPGGSIRKESRSDSPFYKAGNSYTGKKNGVFLLFLFIQQEILITKVFSKAVKNHFTVYLLLFWAKLIIIRSDYNHNLHTIHYALRLLILQKKNMAI